MNTTVIAAAIGALATITAALIAGAWARRQSRNDLSEAAAATDLLEKLGDHPLAQQVIRKRDRLIDRWSRRRPYWMSFVARALIIVAGACLAGGVLVTGWDWITHSKYSTPEGFGQNPVVSWLVNMTGILGVIGLGMMTVNRFIENWLSPEGHYWATKDEEDES